jgi:hypothetical protein
MALDNQTKDAINLAARRAGEAAAKRTLLSIGVDASTPAEVREFQKDMIHLRNQRLAVGSRGRYWVIIFSTIMTVLGAVITMTIQRVFGVHL